MPISAVDAISPAFEHTKQQLTKPFRLGQWARLALVGFLAGELSSGGGCSMPRSFTIPQQPSGSDHLLSLSIPGINPALYAGLIAILVVCGLVLWILFLYVSSVMRFVLFDSLVARYCEIRKRWHARQGPGLRLFVWQLLVLLATIVIFTILVGVPAAIAFGMGWMKAPKEHLVPLILGGMILFFVFLALVVAMVVVHVFTKDFVVPQMALENISAIEGWRRLLPQVQSEVGGYAGYAGMKIVMALAAAVVIGVVSVVAFLVLLIPFGGFGAIAILLGKAGGLTWNAYTITLAIVVGTIFLCIMLYTVSFISVPVVVFFPAYALYFYGARYAPLSAVLYPAPAPIPVTPPPLMPPEPIG
ncbi:MAG TPA: hypothetical protein VFA68_05465 [Terriglobales bacterium]|nr:hypothetical protein [Terriglobales bacterium]